MSAAAPLSPDLATGSAPQGPGSRFRAISLPHSPKIIAGLVLLGVFVVLAIIGPLWAPYSPDLTCPAPPPPPLHAAALPAGCNGNPFIGVTVVQKAVAPSCSGLFCTSGSPEIDSYSPLPPSGAHWLGTTAFAQDAWSQLLVGARATLLVGLLAGALATAMSVLVGVSAGYLGGLADEGLSVLSNVFLAIPGLPLLIVLAGFVSNSGNNSATGGVIFISIIVAITGWAYGARVLRAQTLSLRNRDFVEAARVSGEGRLRIIISEVLPNLVPIVASGFLFTTLYAIGAYVALSFLGLAGAPGSGGVWNWGLMMQQAWGQNALVHGDWWWWAPPGVAVALLGTCFALLNFGIDEFINPRLRAAGLTRKAARRAHVSFRARLGYTPVMISTPAASGMVGGPGVAR
ncbi:MAG TPA: ABC transporter permease [Candidatus Binatia bacterium]|nr:ABC transporter permease [Candidatus Binatia bacterium]